MRAVERAAGGGVAGAVVAQHGAVALLDLDRRMGRQQPLHPAFERDLGRGKIGIAATVEHALQPADGFGTQARDRDRKLGGFVLDRVEPMRVRLRLVQQPVARTQRALERIDPAAVLGIDREHQPIEKAPPLRRRRR